MSDRKVTFEIVGLAKCPYSIALEYVSDYMSRFSNVVAETVAIPYSTLGLPWRGTFESQVDVTFTIVEDRDSRSRSHQALNFSWHARAKYLPNLHGVLCFHIAGDGQTELALQCEYEPREGTVGKVLDFVAGRRLARATGKGLLERIAADIEGREKQFRATLLTVPG